MKNEINFSACLNPLSYGIVGINIFDQLVKNGYKVNLFPIGNVDIEEKYHKQLLESVNNTPNNRDVTSLKIFHEFALAEHVGSGKHIGWPIFEITNFEGQRRRHLQCQDELVVCSEWARRILEANGFKQPIRVVPLGVDTDIFFPSQSPRKGDELVFITIGKREYRKNQIEILECFEKAFKPTDKVKLIVVWGSPLLQQRNPAEHDRYTRTFMRSRMASKIELVEWVDSQREIVELLHKADCGLFLSKAEGFNLGCLESLACGLQNITMNYSGPTIFSNNSNSHLVETTTFEDIFDGVWFTEQRLGQWASFGRDQIDQTVSYMRSLYERRMNGDDLINYTGIETAKQFTWENTATKLLEIL